MTQICTTIEQSNRLLDAGIRPDTATIFWVRRYDWDDCFLTFVPDVYKNGYATKITPAWDLAALIEMMPYKLTDKRGPGRIKRFDLFLNKIQICYRCCRAKTPDLYFSQGNMFENATSAIEWLIKNDSLREGWLVEKGGKE